MSVLTDTDILKRICTTAECNDAHAIHIHPYDESCLTPVGYDFRIGSSYASAKEGGKFSLKAGEQIRIQPGDTVLVLTLETLSMPRDKTLSAFIVSKVSVVSQGISHISTSIDPDWTGHLLIAMTNTSTEAVTLEYGKSFCTVMFVQNVSPATRSCKFPPNRPDILEQVFANMMNRAKRKTSARDRARVIVAIGVVVVACVAGWIAFGSTPGMIATTALGVAIAERLANLIIRN